MTQRLVGMLLQQWEEVEGYAVAHSIPSLYDMGLRPFASFLWWWFVREADAAEVAKFRARLWRPPPGTRNIPARSPWSAESEKAAFGSFKAQAMGTVPIPTTGSAPA